MDYYAYDHLLSRKIDTSQFAYDQLLDDPNSCPHDRELVKERLTKLRVQRRDGVRR